MTIRRVRITDLAPPETWRYRSLLETAASSARFLIQLKTVYPSSEVWPEMTQGLLIAVIIAVNSSQTGKA